MDLSWTPDQLKLKQDVIDFANNNLNNNIAERDRDLHFSRQDWNKCAEFGIQGLASPLEYGGPKDNIDILTATLAMEGLGYGCKDNGLPFSLNAQMWTVQLPIAHFGTEYQKEKYLKQLSAGEIIGCHALTETNAGSDVFNMETQAKKVEGGYILNGSKRLITLAPVADVALVFAKTNPKLGKWGVSGFLVETKSEGVTVSKNKAKMGMRTVPIGDLEFNNCFIPEENRLGKEGAGWSITISSLEYDRCNILGSQLGAMERQLDSTIKFVKDRKQFGKSIGKFQSVSNRIANMKLRLETSKLLLYKVAWLKSKGESAMMEAALLKLHLSESFIESSLDAIRCHGGSGYLTDFEVERDLRDAVGGVIYAGTSDIQRNIISQILGL
ncbi:L-prolyl-[peptidyl carrier protein] dehydrogenase [Hyunsoonleella jejuensis]|uniref:L-prolyl-[peptidyl carrier protein] dehydrogenase n=1 Tax=Hyunsoonleella jejuensis TaxID=419940 RepID=A0A1H9KJM4_9FLAO|nr:acyl-CoA dehydrogenase family protein [Hyunsoonleella jejuensis]SEQ99117.1 L-prolyl-[peptidyl carrier protein] dehydrogenase [Hyunsoonleella jejuensis]